MLIRFAEVLRDIARGGLAGMIAGLIVGGLGGRVAMMLAARMNPGATGMFTENGELIGAFTLNGTFALMIFGGLLLGLVAGIVWVVLSPWLPASGRAAGSLRGSWRPRWVARSSSRRTTPTLRFSATTPRLSRCWCFWSD